MKLLLDLGNTRLKWAVLDVNGLGPMRAEALDKVTALPPATSAILASSCGDSLKLARLQSLLIAAGIFSVQRIEPPHSDGLLSLAYAEPHTLGVDRWLAMRAACVERDSSSSRAFIVASAGSALTVDAVDDAGVHLGGCIAPGVSAMRRALLASAPHLEGARGELQEFADSTINAVYSGPLLAAAALIERQRATLAQRVGYSPRLIVTGGDAQNLLPLVSKAAYYIDDLVLRGMQTLVY